MDIIDMVMPLLMAFSVVVVPYHDMDTTTKVMQLMVVVLVVMMSCLHASPS